MNFNPIWSKYCGEMALDFTREFLFKKRYNQNDSTFIKSVFEFFIKPSFSITWLSINMKELNYGQGLLINKIYLE